MLETWNCMSLRWNGRIACIQRGRRWCSAAKARWHSRGSVQIQCLTVSNVALRSSGPSNVMWRASAATYAPESTFNISTTCARLEQKTVSKKVWRYYSVQRTAKKLKLFPRRQQISQHKLADRMSLTEDHLNPLPIMAGNCQALSARRQLQINIMKKYIGYLCRWRHHISASSWNIKTMLPQTHG